MAYVPVAQETPWQQSDKVDLARCAVVVVDILGGCEGPTPGTEAAAANAGRIVKAARAKGVSVIFSDDAHDSRFDAELELWGDHGVAGSESAQPLADFDLQPSDIVVPKRRYSGFFQTDLDLLLRELGVRTVVAVGCDTNVCVLHTLADAYFRGYDSVLVEDATRTFLCGSQEGAVEHCRKCFGSVVASTDELVAALA